MPPPAPSSSSSRGSALTRKLGPLPVWAWAAAGLVLGYIVYRHFTGSSGSGGQAQETQTVRSTSPAAALGAATSAGAPSDTGQTTSDYIAALGAQNSSLLQSLEALSSDVAGLAASQISYAQANTNLGSFSTQTGYGVGDMPGGANAPTVTHVAPSVAGTAGAPAAVHVAAKPAKPAPSRYFTYKRDVKLSPGQSIHFTAGRGYYAYG